METAFAKGSDGDDQVDEALSPIFRRRSIRHYKAQPVEQETIIHVLRAAMAAPTACNSQPWEFVVVTEPEIIGALKARLYAGRYNAPAAIVICGNPEIANNSSARHFWVQDCSAAAQNVLIAATELGLGSVWIGVYPLPSVMKPVSEVLNLPANVVPLCVIYIGYPDEEKAPRTQYDEYRVHWQQYEPRKKRPKTKNAKYLP